LAAGETYIVSVGKRAFAKVRVLRTLDKPFSVTG
jgi:hypothetical protein